MFFFKRKDLPISGFVGMNGSGKTALAVEQALRAAKGRTLYTTTPITPPEGWVGEVVLIENLSQMDTFCCGHVFLDEISMILPARGTGNLPPEFVLMLASLRHEDLTMSWTAPTVQHCDVSIRRVTQSITALRSVFSKKTSAGWAQTVVTWASQYDTRAYGEMDVDAKETRMARGFIRLASLPLDSYNTNAPVRLISDHLVCSVCGSPKRKMTCGGHAAEEQQAAQAASLGDRGERKMWCKRPAGSKDEHLLEAGSDAAEELRSHRAELAAKDDQVTKISEIAVSRRDLRLQRELSEKRS